MASNSQESGGAAKPKENNADVPSPLRNTLGFIAMGLINNFHYCLVLSAADSIADGYHLKQWVAMIAWANVFFGFFVKILNAFIYDYISYNVRFLIGGLLTIFGVLTVSVAKLLGSDDTFRFSVAIFGIVFVGLGSSYGESVALGYLERFRSKTIGGWASGTGMSGVAGSLIYLGLQAIGVSNEGAFLLSIPFVFAYWIVYFFQIQTPILIRSEAAVAGSTSEKEPLIQNGEASSPARVFQLLPNFKGTSWKSDPKRVADQVRRDAELETVFDSFNQQSSEGSGTVEPSWVADLRSAVKAGSGMLATALKWRWKAPVRWFLWKHENWENLKRVHKTVLWNDINLALVYVFEYAAQFVAPFAFPCRLKHSDNFFMAHTFVITQFCYQIGVLCSRSSLSCIRIRRVDVLTVCQLVNAIGWFIQAKVKFISSDDDGTEQKLVWVLFAWMYVVGLFGGASYVNVFYNILETQSISTKKSGEEAAVTVGEAKPTSPPTVAVADRELAMNIGTMYATGGITMGALVDVVFAITVLTEKCP